MLEPKKSLGQNFLQDKNILKKINAAIDCQNDDMLLEIGPGAGALTEFLLKTDYKKFIAADIDNRAVELLNNMFSDNLDDNCKIIQQDIREFDITKEFSLSEPEKIIVCGNIPYNISADILFKVIENRKFIKKAVFLVQKEVAQRIVSKHHSKTYGIQSVLFKMISDAKILFDVSPNCFFPKPKVISSVIEIKFQTEMEIENFEEFKKFVKAAFSQRRKKLSNSLKSYLTRREINDDQRQNLVSFLDKRVEQLSPEEFYEMFKIIH